MLNSSAANAAADRICQQFGNLDHYEKQIAQWIDPFIQGAVSAAVAAEREECAAVAWRNACTHDHLGCLHEKCKAARKIEAQIRARGNPPEDAA